MRVYHHLRERHERAHSFNALMYKAKDVHALFNRGKFSQATKKLLLNNNKQGSLKCKMHFCLLKKTRERKRSNREEGEAQSMETMIGRNFSYETIWNFVEMLWNSNAADNSVSNSLATFFVKFVDSNAKNETTNFSRPLKIMKIPPVKETKIINCASVRNWITIFSKNFQFWTGKTASWVTSHMTIVGKVSIHGKCRHSSLFSLTSFTKRILFSFSLEPFPIA